ncbi:MAG TPA: histidine kinase dimerization/phospho-acceptor domain-containing protein [Bryobacteraceae bacterium]|nr:histidine kinase dimerization/phospho-acceptor domain-containing protein [Bryobacteraceae bacterium]
MNRKFGRAPPAAENHYARLAAQPAQAVLARDEFIAIAAHELRNPMTPILGYTECLLAIGRRPESEYPEAIIFALERMVGLIGPAVHKRQGINGR